MYTGENFKEVCAAIKKHVHLGDLIGEHVKLKHEHGSIYYGYCPFHEKQHHESKELAVNVTRGVYYCFACHNNGDAITFICNKLNMTQAQAIDFLLNKYNLHDKINPKKIILRVKNG